MRVLGLGCGNPGGSAELLLNAALMEAEQAGAEVVSIRLAELRLPPRPAEGADDAPWVWEQLMECDALIASAPILSRTVPANLRVLGDRILGPNADAAFTRELLRLKAEGVAPQVPFRVDERVLKPRVAGFLSVGGSLPAHWKTLALPLMHTLTFSLHIAVVDQAQFAGAGTPQSVVLDDAAMERAAQLGRHVASQLGRAFEDAEYVGEEGLCPMCHLDVIAVRGETIECATCGARGYLVPNGGELTVHFPPEGREQSVISMTEKHAHFLEVQETARAQGERADEIRDRAAPLASFDRRISP